MAEPIVLKDTILLLDSYSQNAIRLHESFLRAGCSCSVVVLEEDPFLPEGVMSVYDLFLGYFQEEGRQLGKPRFFNEIPVPDHWSIHAGVGEADYGRITCQHEEKGRIYYWESPRKWLVKTVDWLDRRGGVRFRDHYNRYGAVYARTCYDDQGRELGRTWLTAAGQEAIVENAVTGDLIVNDKEMVKFFRHKRDMMLYFLNRAGAGRRQVCYNSLGDPFWISGRLDPSSKRDILFWQEAVEEGIPESMQGILEGRAPRTGKVLLQKRGACGSWAGLGADGARAGRLGYIYDFKKENGHGSEALICTNSERIEHCEELIRAFPEMHFHIAAVTLMSPKLMSLDAYSNVSLYPCVQQPVLDKLFLCCDYYFDINHWTEIVSAVYQAFLHKQLIFAFSETIHNREYVADAHVYPVGEFDRMVSDVKEVMEDGEALERHLRLQLEDAMAEEGQAYLEALCCGG